MKKLLVAAMIAVSFCSFEVRAQERAGSAALGAVSGAVVLGPVGAVAGAFIGYAAGPSIARSWGIRRSVSRPWDASHPREASRPDDRGATRSAAGASEPQAQQQKIARASSPPVVKPPEKLATKTTAPPVQGFE
jgi:hypothetical protein